eukprot:3080327-Pyramimonas_sp.AAC.1
MGRMRTWLKAQVLFTGLGLRSSPNLRGQLMYSPSSLLPSLHRLCFPTPLTPFVAPEGAPPK